MLYSSLYHNDDVLFLYIYPGAQEMRSVVKLDILLKMEILENQPAYSMILKCKLQFTSLNSSVFSSDLLELLFLQAWFGFGSSQTDVQLLSCSQREFSH